MKIAQISPLFESVPPKMYGGTERVISYLTEELVRQGHDVTLFATGDSVTAATLVSVVKECSRDSMLDQSWIASHLVQLDLALDRANDFDVMHFHTDCLHFPAVKRSSTPHVTTLHGRLDLPHLAPLYRHFKDIPLVSISRSQRTPLPWVHWHANVYHGLPLELYSFRPDPGDYFVFVGRISPEKRLERAVEIAIACGRPLYIGAKIEKMDAAYYNDCIKPLLRHPLVTYIGEIGEEEKHELLAHATALLFPIDWPEPFGLVMIEAFACGTPVIAYANGSVPEIMEDKITGFVVASQEEAIQAGHAIGSINRRNCRDAFERRFTAAHMAEKYLQAYRRLLSA